MFDLSAPIVPGKSAAGIELGQSIAEIIKNNQPTNVQSYEKSTRYCFNSVDLWIEVGRVIQIGVKRGYHGVVQGAIGIGSSIYDVQLTLGKVIHDDEDNLTVPTIAGWCFETETWQYGPEIDDNLDSLITKIFVYAIHKTL
jgi:hypothetical protein